MGLGEKDGALEFGPFEVETLARETGRGESDVFSGKHTLQKIDLGGLEDNSIEKIEVASPLDLGKIDLASSEERAVEEGALFERGTIEAGFSTQKPAIFEIRKLGKDFFPEVQGNRDDITLKIEIAPLHLTPKDLPHFFFRFLEARIMEETEGPLRSGPGRQGTKPLPLGICVIALY